VPGKRSPSVFDLYAHEYDLITNAAQREKYHQKEVDALIARFRPKRVLDAGCASGLTTMLFARRGVTTVGLDKSPRMIETARSKFAGVDLPLEFVKGDFERLPRKMHGRFDLIVCLANSVSGVTSRVGLRRALKNFYSVLRPGGRLVVQMLNYAAVKEGVLFPIRATENNGVVYERFTERRGRRMFVYVTRLDLNERPPRYEVFRHEFDNYDVDLMIRLFTQLGFSPLRRYSDLYLTKRFGKHSSRDLVLVGRRPIR